VVIDVASYLGHPELDLALVDYFDPVRDDVFDAYRDIAAIITASPNAASFGVFSVTLLW
jgi:fructosamine-3-kinase